MIKKRSSCYKFTAFSLLFLLILPFILFGGTTGKIRGLVKDAKTNELLPGVNVILSHVWQEGNEVVFGGIGAASNNNGEYIILKVPPGVYTLTATMMGYQKSIHQRVRVSVDRTSTVDFMLAEEVLDLNAEIVVQAERDIVQLDVSSTENYISEKDYRDTPFANRVEDVIGMQSGVTGNIIEGEINIREGDAREIGMMMDGMLMVDKKFNRPVMTINTGVVQEIKVMRNGFNAEYGQSRSGMINVVTKDPSNRYNFSVDYQFEPARKRHYGRSIYDPLNRWEWRLLTGPRAMEGDSLFLNEGRLGQWKYWRGWNKVSEELVQDNNPNNDLTPDEALELWKWQHRPIAYGDKTGHNMDLAFSGPLPVLPFQTKFLAGFKYEYRPFTFPQSRSHYDEKVSSLKLVSKISSDIKLTLSGLYSETYSVTQGYSTSEWSEEDRLSYDGGGSEIFYPYRKPTADRYTSIIGLKWTHTLSPKSFYEINLNHWNVQWTIGRGDSAKVEDGRYFHDRLYLDPHSGWIDPKDGVIDLGSGNKLFGGGFTWDDSYNRRTVVNLMYTNQFHPAHELKAGYEFSYDIVHQNRVFWDYEDPNQEFHYYHHGKPIEMAAFLQDKIEFKGMIANLGLRLDYYHTNTEQFDIHRVLDHDENDLPIWSNTNFYEAVKNGTFPKYTAKPRFYLSPRIGISHPLTERSKIYFNYGHFVQSPPTEAVYQLTLDSRMPRVQWMGNGEMTFQITVAYELGYDHNLWDLFQLHLGAFYKDYHEAASGMVYAHSNQSLVVEWASQRENREIRGIEIELRKSYGRWLSGWFNYTLSKKSVSDLEIPDLSDIPIITDDPTVGINGELKGVPRPNVSDVVPYGRGVVTLMVPSTWGPQVSGIPIFGNTSLSLQLYYQGGGRVNHPNREFRAQHPDVKFYEIDRYWANMRLNKLFYLGRTQLELYMDVSSILHSKFRELPGGQAREDYFNDLYNSGRLDQLGTDKLTDPSILNTESDNVYWAKFKYIIFGLRFNL